MTIYANGLTGGLGAWLSPALAGEGAVFIARKRVEAKFRIDLERLAPNDGSFFRPGDLFIFVAALSKPEECAADRDRAWRINVANTVELIRRARGNGANALFFSSDVVYGQQPEGRVDEGASLLGAEPYALMKKAVEEEFATDSGVKAFRLSYVVTGDDSFCRYLDGCASSGRDVELFEEYERNMICVDDVIAATLIATRNWERVAKVTNLGGPACIGKRFLAEAYGRGRGLGLNLRSETPPDGYFRVRARRIALDVGRLTELLERPPRPIAADLFEKK